MEKRGVHSLDAGETAKLRESFERCTSETIEAILRFRSEHDLDSALTSVHGIIERYTKPDSGVQVEQLPDKTRLREDLDIDSLTMIEIVMSIEEALDFQLHASDTRNIRTLGDMRQYMDDRIHDRPQSAATVEIYDRDRLWVILPQQPPFLFLDKAEIQGETVRASYLFRGNEVFFPGHFLNDPVVPASIVYEALGQACCLWILEHVPARLQQTLATNHVFFVGMDEARFFKRAKPGDEIQISMQLTRLRAPLAVFQGQVKARDELIARVKGLTLAFGDLHSAAAEATADAKSSSAVHSSLNNGATVEA